MVRRYNYVYLKTIKKLAFYKNMCIIVIYLLITDGGIV